MRKKLRCRLGRHAWVMRVEGGDECVVCRDCGTDGSGRDVTRTTKPPWLGSTPTGYYPRDYYRRD